MRFENVLNSDVSIVKAAGHDGPAVKRKRREIEAGESHHRAGNRLIAAADGDHRVKHVRTHEKLDGIGNHLARNERALHTFGAHGDSVGDRDGVKFDGSAARGAHTFLHFLGERAQMKVTRSNLRPSIRDRDQGLRQVRVLQAGGLEHGAGRRAGDSFFYFVTVHLALASSFL